MASACAALKILRSVGSERYGDVVVLGERCGVDGGQELGQSLRKALQAGVARRSRRSVGGIVRESVAIDLQKVGGVRVRCAQCKDQGRGEA